MLLRLTVITITSNEVSFEVIFLLKIPVNISVRLQMLQKYLTTFFQKLIIDLSITEQKREDST